MFFAHVGAALAARPAAPNASLGVLMVCAMALDTVCGVLTAMGIERVDAGASTSIPWSHGLLMSVVWSAAAFGIAMAASRDARTSVVIGTVVLSHWVLDFISHPMGLGTSMPPDLPLLFEGSPKVGLGLYTWVAAAVPVEIGLFAAGIAVYLLTTRARDRTGAWIFWLVPLLLFAIAFYPLLPSALRLFPAFAVLLLLPTGILVDRHRCVRSRPRAGSRFPSPRPGVHDNEQCPRDLHRGKERVEGRWRLSKE